MGIPELVIAALALSADAFSVSVCKGLTAKERIPAVSLLCGIWFGAFQAAMPLAGFFLGSTLAGYVSGIAHWIAFAILSLIGLNMIRESRSEEGEREKSAATDAVTMFLLAVATSIDALAAGVSFAMVQVRILPAVLLIGSITFVCSFLGVRLGGLLGRRFQTGAQIAGGVILIFLGIRALLSGLL